MPKVLVGCLVFVLVIAVGGAGLAYFKFVKPFTDTAVGVARFAQEYQELNDQLRDTSRYTPPANNQMTEVQFQRFLGANTAMRNQLSHRLNELEQKYQELDNQMRRADRDPSMRELMEGYRDMIDLMLEAKRAQVTALNQYNFSLEEYIWVRNHVYLALGQSVGVVDLGDSQMEHHRHHVTEEAAAWVEEHRDALMETYVLAWFGL